MQHIHSATCGCKDVAFSHQSVDLIGNIDKDNIRCLNEAVPNTGKLVFKTEDKRLEEEPFVESDIDGELLFHLNFKSVVKIKQIRLIASSEENCPMIMKLYKNQENIDFQIAENEPVQQFDIIPNLDGEAFYSTKFSKFQDVASLTIYLQNENIDDIKVQYIQIKGEATNIKKGIIVDAVYEIRPTSVKNDQDERIGNKDMF